MAETCAVCGFDWDVDAGELATVVSTFGRSYDQRLRGTADERLRRQLNPEVWSPLEYGCHVRDVLFNQRDRVLLALIEDVPTFHPIHRDERVGLAGYAEEAPADVATGIVLGADLLAHLLQRLTPTQWDRTGIYGYPSSAERDLRWIGRNVVHELQHHLVDIDRQVG